MKLMDRLCTSKVQTALMGLIGLFVPGMFWALTGMGAGGLEDPSINSNALTAMYICITITCIIGSGTIVNLIGYRSTFIIASIVHIIYIASLWTYHKIMSSALVIVAGSLLGIGTSLLWAAQGCIMVSYPLEHEKGQFISMYWSIANAGTVFGSLCSFALNYYNETKELSDYTYLTFTAFILFGMFISFLICPIDKVIRSDGVNIVKEELHFKDHIRLLGNVYTNKIILILFPLFLTSNFYYTYQFNTFNAALFNVRTRSLNNSLYWITEILAAPLFGYLLDLKFFSVKQRGLGFTVLLALLLIVSWSGNYVVQHHSTRINLIDFMDSNYISHLCVYLGFSIADVCYQLTMLWMIGKLSSDPQIVGSYFGFSNCAQSIGAAVAWQINVIGINPDYEMLIIVILFGIVILCLGGVATRLPFTGESTSHLSDEKSEIDIKLKV